MSTFGSISKSNTSRDNSFASRASGFGSTKKNLLNRIDDLGLDGKKSILKGGQWDPKSSLNFNDDDTNQAALSVSKYSYTGNTQMDTSSLRNNRGQKRPKQKLSMSKDHYTSR